MTKKLLSVLMSGLTGLAVSNCDTFDPDVTPEVITATIYATESGMGLVDLERAFVGWDYNSLKVVENPASGDLSISGKSLLYLPRQGSVNDKFTANINSGSRKAIVHANVVAATATDPCAKDPITYVEMSKNSVVIIDLFDSKDFCGYPRNGGWIGTCTAASLNNDTNQAIDIALMSSRDKSYAVFTYAPRKDFVGQYRLIYTMAADDVGDEVAGNDSWCTDASRSDYFSRHEIVIDVKE